MSLLTAGPRDLPERQRTLRNTLDWSFGLLSADEQALFTRLAVFAGSFGLPAVAAICGDAIQGPVIDTLSSLVDSSLVKVEPSGDEPRFSLLDTIREYAAERLRCSGGWRDVHDRHAAYFAALAKPADTELHGAGQLAWLNRLETRRGNLGAALAWLAGQDQTGKALDLVWATWRFWWLHGHVEELARHVDQILARSDAMPPHQRALALSGAGFVRFVGGDRAQALRLLKRSLPLYRQSGDRLGMGLTAAALGHLLAAQGRLAIATDLLGQTLTELRKMAGDQLSGPEQAHYLLDVALASNFLGQIRLGQGEHHHATQLFTDGLAAAHSAADRFTIIVSLYDLALGHQAAGELDDAADLLRQGVSLAAEAGDEPSLAYHLEALADLAARQNHPERAASLLGAASALLEANGSGWLHAYVPRAPHDDTALAGLRARTTDVGLPPGLGARPVPRQRQRCPLRPGGTGPGAARPGRQLSPSSPCPTSRYAHKNEVSDEPADHLRRSYPRRGHRNLQDRPGHPGTDRRVPDLARSREPRPLRDERSDASGSCRPAAQS